jgi:phytoene dehydrogenase-like protein
MNQPRAAVIGAGPNGLSAAIVLAQAGMQVEVFEAQPVPGGGARTFELTLPGFRHDFGSAIHPMAVSSPLFSSLPLERYGLEWIHPSAPLAHPLDDGSAVMLERNLEDSVLHLGADGKAWRRLMRPYVERWPEFIDDVLRPIKIIPKHPFMLAGFGLKALAPARWLANRLFRENRAKALFAGIAAHSFLSLDEAMSSAFAVILGAAGHAVGWPMPKGGAQSLTNALCAHLQTLGGTITTSRRIEDLRELANFNLVLCDITPAQLLNMAGKKFSPTFKRQLSKYRYGSGVFKVDYALSQPIPWKAAECLRAGTVHVCGDMAETAASESAVRRGKHPERPFVLLAQQSLFDPTRAPAGKHIGWAYCHVPNGSTFDMLPRLEAQIERFAPGFRDCVLHRSISTPARLEGMDANLIGGDIGGGAPDIDQFFFRPTFRQYATSAPDVFICSSSTPPGGGVHGMCGYNAAKLALAKSSLIFGAKQG